LLEIRLRSYQAPYYLGNGRPTLGGKDGRENIRVGKKARSAIGMSRAESSRPSLHDDDLGVVVFLGRTGCPRVLVTVAQASATVGKLKVALA